MKTCAKCRIEKPLDDFFITSKKTGKRHSYCKPCFSEWRREWHANHPDMQKIYKKKWETANIEAHRAAKRRRYHKDTERSRALQRAWRLTNADWVVERNAKYAATRRWGQLRRDTGLTPEDFLVLWERQDGKCSICTLPLLNRRLTREERSQGVGMVQVDHDHFTGAIRGFLCHRCNMGIGAFRDNEIYLRRAAEYLEHVRETPTGFAFPEDAMRRWEQREARRLARLSPP